MAYTTRSVTFEVRLFWYMAYRTRNITCEARFFGIWLIERGILHYFETSFLWFMTYRTMKLKSHLKRSCFGIWLIERGIVRNALVLVYGL